MNEAGRASTMICCQSQYKTAKSSHKSSHCSAPAADQGDRMWLLFDHFAGHAAVIPAERAGLCPASEEPESSIPPHFDYAATSDYWIPARASPAQPGSLGRDDRHMR
jgi:hypothetical protein